MQPRCWLGMGPARMIASGGLGVGPAHSTTSVRYGALRVPNWRLHFVCTFQTVSSCWHTARTHTHTHARMHAPQIGSIGWHWCMNWAHVHTHACMHAQIHHSWPLVRAHMHQLVLKRCTLVRAHMRQLVLKCCTLVRAHVHRLVQKRCTLELLRCSTLKHFW